MKFVALLTLGLLIGCSGGGGSGNGTGDNGEEQFTFQDVTDKSQCNGVARYNSPFRGWNMELAGTGNKTGRKGRMKVRMYVYQDSMVMSNQCDFGGAYGYAEVTVPIRINENSREVEILESRERTNETNGVRCGIIARKTRLEYYFAGNCLVGRNRDGEVNSFIAD